MKVSYTITPDCSDYMLAASEGICILLEAMLPGEHRKKLKALIWASERIKEQMEDEAKNQSSK